MTHSESSGDEHDNHGNHDNRDEIKVVTESEKKIWNVAANLYKGANKTEHGNLVFSPLSLTSSMVMLNLGAGGETATEIQSLFQFETNSQLAIRNQVEVVNALKTQTSEKDVDIKFMTASRIYANSQNVKLRENYVRAVSSLGEVESLDFTESKTVVAEINEWVKNETQRKIPEIVEEKDFGKETAVVLLNTLYFKAPWKQPFNPKDTEKADFHVGENEKVEVEMMYLAAEFPYADLDQVEATAIFLPYKGDRMSMIIYLPWKERKLSTLEEKLENLIPSEIRNEATTTEISLHLPKFKFSSALDFKEILASLGVQKMFKREEADFNKLSESDGFHVSKVLQNVFIEVNEEGSEAAAATGIIGLAPVSAPNVLKVDRPFIFQIYDSLTGAVLISGRISNPKEEGNHGSDGSKSGDDKDTENGSWCNCLLRLFQSFL